MRDLHGGPAKTLSQRSQFLHTLWRRPIDCGQPTSAGINQWAPDTHSHLIGSAAAIGATLDASNG